MNHHAVLGRLDRADHVILLLNLLLLLCIGVVPFATALMPPISSKARVRVSRPGFTRGRSSS